MPRRAIAFLLALLPLALVGCFGLERATPVGSLAVADYSADYAATRETMWTADPALPAAAHGSLPPGTIVRFAQEPTRSTVAWQRAELPDGSLKYVHPGDFARPVAPTAMSR